MLNLTTLNSATKYPSIETYHALGERGALTEEVTRFHGEVILTEKVDGTNVRIIRMPDGDWFIGSREELLTARGDRVRNPALGIVDAVHSIAEQMKDIKIKDTDTDEIAVYYLETYGAKIGGQARQYTGTGRVGWRMFDIAFVPFEALGWDREQIAAWRDGGGQRFAEEPVLQRAAEAQGLELTPRLATLPAESLPATVDDAHAWLAETLPRTLVGLDARAGGRPEGIVLRTPDRSVIAKARNEDYARTVKRRGR